LYALLEVALMSKYSNFIYKKYGINITKINTLSGFALKIYLSSFYKQKNNIKIIKGNIEYWILNIEHWILNIEHWTLNIEHWTLNIEHWKWY